MASGKLGSHNGLPVTMVITTTLTELHSGAGHASTGGTTLSPMSEVIRQAADDLLIETTDRTTRTRPDGRTEWLRPPHLDIGQTRTNNYHHPHRYLTHNNRDSDDHPP